MKQSLIILAIVLVVAIVATKAQEEEEEPLNCGDKTNNKSCYRCCQHFGWPSGFFNWVNGECQCYRLDEDGPCPGRENRDDCDKCCKQLGYDLTFYHSNIKTCYCQFQSDIFGVEA